MTELSPTPFWFLRHGETDWNLAGLSQGRVDIALNDTGRAQARAAAGLLAGRGINSIVCSTLGRARETAAIVGGALGLSYSMDVALQETAFGDQEGRKMGPWYDEWVEERYTPAGGESFAALRARVVPALNRALLRPGLVLVIAHGAMFRAVRAEMGLSAKVRTANGVPVFCEPGQKWALKEAVVF